MWRIAWQMLAADRAKFIGLLFGIAFTAFLVCFAAAYFCGFMTAGFALVSENPEVQVWVMDPAVSSTEQTINLSDTALERVRSVAGVRAALPLALGNVDARFADGHFQTLQVLGVDAATLVGAPRVAGVEASALRADGAAILAAGGTSDKLLTPIARADQWPRDGLHLQAPRRELAAGDELLINDHRVQVLARADGLARFPPRPLLYATLSTARQLLPNERHWLTFVLVQAQPGVDPAGLARRIETRTGLRARTAAEFKDDTVWWYLANSEDVGDIGAMLILAMTLGFGVTGILLYLFTYESQRHYAVLKALGATTGTLKRMVLAQAGACALIGSGIGLGLCGLAGEAVVAMGYPFRMLWFTPVLGLLGVLIVCLTAAWISLRPVLRLEPGMVFAGR